MTALIHGQPRCRAVRTVDRAFDAIERFPLARTRLRCDFNNITDCVAAPCIRRLGIGHRKTATQGLRVAICGRDWPNCNLGSRPGGSMISARRVATDADMPCTWCPDVTRHVGLADPPRASCNGMPTARGGSPPALSRIETALKETAAAASAWHDRRGPASCRRVGR
ncbi:hypothetical protein [Palleronia rufa]|uniref:hypothetical protein n=1 Tax=Palleronia rufa TaxID=1530186 RepID=UPI0039F01ECF